jgi:hypothetical protein
MAARGGKRLAANGQENHMPNLLKDVKEGRVSIGSLPAAIRPNAGLVNLPGRIAEVDRALQAHSPP